MATTAERLRIENGLLLKVSDNYIEEHNGVVVIPDSVTKIGFSSFKNRTNLTSVTIPDSVTEIGISVFEGCTNLTSVTISDSVTKFGNRAFKDCGNIEVIYVNTEKQRERLKGMFPDESATKIEVIRGKQTKNARTGKPTFFKGPEQLTGSKRSSPNTEQQTPPQKKLNQSTTSLQNQGFFGAAQSSNEDKNEAFFALFGL